jgi:ABC-type transport system substrate-binding protein
VLDGAGPWGTGPYKLVHGFARPEGSSPLIVLEANTQHWNPKRFPRFKRIVYDNTLAQKDALELVKSREGRVDLVTEVIPRETLRVAESPFATLVKHRDGLGMVFGYFNLRKSGSPWEDARLRQAANFAINRADLIEYAVKGNGLIVPALLSPRAFGFNPELVPYPFDTARARTLLTSAGYPNGLSVNLIAPDVLQVQATVIKAMLVQAGFKVDLEILDAGKLAQRTLLSNLDRPAAEQTWDIALTSDTDYVNFAVYFPYQAYAVGGATDWLGNPPTLKRLHDEALSTVDRERQKALIRQMERHTHEQAYFLFLYSPIKMYAVNKNVKFVPYATTILNLGEAAPTAEHWSLSQTRAR